MPKSSGHDHRCKLPGEVPEHRISQQLFRIALGYEGRIDRHEVVS
jgi:hypothetical protein